MWIPQRVLGVVSCSSGFVSQLFVCLSGSSAGFRSGKGILVFNSREEKVQLLSSFEGRCTSTKKGNKKQVIKRFMKDKIREIHLLILVIGSSCPIHVIDGGLDAIVHIRELLLGLRVSRIGFDCLKIKRKYYFQGKERAG